MALFKGIDFPDDVAPLARHMASLDDHRETLAALSQSWDTLGLLAHLCKFEADVSEVRASFATLAGELLACLGEESLRRAARALGLRARIAIDLLARDLSERGAGIGVLATDAAIVDACATRDPARLDALRRRLCAYAECHAVHRDVVLMAPDGQVLARANDGFERRSTSGIVPRALAQRGGGVETWEPTDFCGGALALTCAWRVEQDGCAIGVLALEFDLVRQAAPIFDRLAADDALLAFVDAAGRVAVSNDAARLPAGRPLALRPGAASLRLGGVTHVATRVAAAPDRGDAGPGWSAIALAPVELAFEHDGAPGVDIGFSGETVFPRQLLDLPLRAREIQRRLDRLVWNGRVHRSADADAFARSLLEEIAATGRKTRAVFERASAELLSTVAAGLLDEARCRAGLAVDLLERSLRERASDSRWWATDPALAALDATAGRTLAPHGTPHVEAMLRAALPDAEGAIAALCRADGAVIARTGELPVTLPADVLALAPGQSWSGVLAEGSQRFVVGASAGRDDRASKTAEGGDEPAIGLVAIPVGTAADRHVDTPPQFDRVTGGTEIATFLIGNQLLGVVASKVIACIEVASAVRVWRGGFAQRHVGFVTWNDMALPLIDIAADVNAAPGAPQRHAIVLQSASHWFGLLVSDLGPVAGMTLSEERGLAGGAGASRLISQLGRAGSVLMPVLSPDAVFGTAG